MNRHESSYSDASEKLELQMHIMDPGWSPAPAIHANCSAITYIYAIMIAVRITP